MWCRKMNGDAQKSNESNQQAIKAKIPLKVKYASLDQSGPNAVTILYAEEDTDYFYVALKSQAEKLLTLQVNFSSFLTLITRKTKIY